MLLPSGFSKGSYLCTSIFAVQVTNLKTGRAVIISVFMKGFIVTGIDLQRLIAF